MSSFSVVEEEIERDPKKDRQENVQSSDNFAGTLEADIQQQWILLRIVRWAWASISWFQVVSGWVDESLIDLRLSNIQ